MNIYINPQLDIQIKFINANKRQTLHVVRQYLQIFHKKKQTANIFLH